MLGTEVLDFEVLGSVSVKIKRMLAFEKRYLQCDSSTVVYFFSITYFSFLCLSEWTNTMSVSILFQAYD